MKLSNIMMLAAACALSACAAVRPTMSYVAPELTKDDAVVLANDAVTFLAKPLPPAKTTLVIDPPSEPKNDVLTEAMLSALRAKGYGVKVIDGQNSAANDNATALRYLASSLDKGVVMRLQYANAEASRFYPRDAEGRLKATLPFAVREATP